MKSVLRSILAAGVFAVSAPVFAATASCVNGDVAAWNTVESKSVLSTACLGSFDAQGNQNVLNQTLLNEINSTWGLALTLTEKVNNGETGSIITGVDEGVITFGGFYAGAFVMAIKQGNDIAAWLFTADQIDGIKGADEVRFDTVTTRGAVFDTANDDGTGISHAVYFGNGDKYEEGPSVVPEAETYAMLLGGLGLIGFVARRRQKSQKVTFA